MDLTQLDKKIAENLDDVGFLIRKSDWSKLSIRDKHELLKLAQNLNWLLTDCY